MTRQNEYPIVFVHGFAGWGKGEVLNMPYWGGLTQDFEKTLNDSGYEAYVATVGPFASNWDRACELYAYIKGGTVDYGKAHSEKYGHNRYGRTYPGVYPKFGKINEKTGEINKIHLVSHSMGGETTRVIAQLLEVRSQEEIKAVLGENPTEKEIKEAIDKKQLSPLFVGNNSWVHSVTTISTPHDGTTLADCVTGIIPLAQQIIALVAAQVGTLKNPIYDFKLDQWGLTKNPNETFVDYANRVWNSSLWTDTKDISAWDLKPDGAKELNSWVHAQPNIYYFSWSTEQTIDTPFPLNSIYKKQLPELGMNVMLMPSATFMGQYTRNDNDHVVIDEFWWKNDGVVNTCSMNGPKIGSTDEIVSCSKVPQKGKWNHLGLLSSTDHMDIVGIGTIVDHSDWYKKHAEYLANLPK